MVIQPNNSRIGTGSEPCDPYKEDSSTPRQRVEEARNAHAEKERVAAKARWEREKNIIRQRDEQLRQAVILIDEIVYLARSKARDADWGGARITRKGILWWSHEIATLDLAEGLCQVRSDDTVFLPQGLNWVFHTGLDEYVPHGYKPMVPASKSTLPTHALVLIRDHLLA